MTVTQPATPELDKIKAITDQSQAIGEFLEWCHSKGYFLAHYPLVREMYPERFTEEYVAKYPEEYDERSQCAHPISKGIQSMLAEFFDIDQVKAERERQAVLEYVRAMQEVSQE